VAVYGLENGVGVPIYVHAKLCIIDDRWAKVGSDNINRRSWTHDSELACAVVDEAPEGRSGDGEGSLARDLRLRLAREHLDRATGDDGDLLDPRSFFDAFASAAARLEAWHQGCRRGPRPPGRLRPVPQPRLSPWSRLWSTPLYRILYDPDGRSRSWRKASRY
jgi:phosphatidylserine/phosphatidylglycerophosphate/cardiolipin synthase-like enzyme